MPRGDEASDTAPSVTLGFLGMRPEASEARKAPSRSSELASAADRSAGGRAEDGRLVSERSQPTVGWATDVLEGLSRRYYVQYEVLQ